MKKGVITLGIIVIISLGIYFAVNQREDRPVPVTETSSTTTFETTMSSPSESTKINDLPSFAELEQRYGTAIIDRGEYMIITAFYKENPRVQLENEQEEVLELGISDIEETEEKITFTINNLETINSRKIIGEKIKLAQEGNQYYEYK